MSYISQIAELLLEQTPELHLLGPSQYLAIAEWEKQGIPPGIIEQAIRTAGRTTYASAPDAFECIAASVNSEFAVWLAGAIPGL